MSEAPKQELKGDTTLPTSTADLKKLMEQGTPSGKYKVEDFFRNAEFNSCQISPDGNYISYTKPYERRMNVYIRKVGDKEETRITSETERDIQGYFWASADRILYLKDSGGDENFKLFAVDKDGKNQKDLTPFDKVRINVIDDLEDSDDEVIIAMNKNNPMLFEPYRLNIKTGDLKQLAENKDVNAPIDGWITDHEGKIRAAVKITGGTNQTLMYRAKEEEPFKDVLTTDFREGVSVNFFDFDNGSVVYASSNLKRDKQAIVKFDLATGKEIGTPIFEHPEVDVDGISYSRKRKVPTSISFTTAKRGRKILDPTTEELYKRLEKDLGKYEISVSSANKNEDRFIVRTYSDRSLGSYYLYDKTADKLEKIADVSPWINEEDMAEVKPITYKSRDGLTINGYLTLPKGLEAKNLPLVVNPHGGPWARDNWGFNSEIQLFANNGFAVLQMNFRGSTGYGRKFWEASFKKWGQEMQNDITDGVNELIKQGIVDPKRVAIYGASYGGYATLAGVAYTPDLYACAIDYVGVSNLLTFLETIPPYWKPYLDMMYTMVGNPNIPEDKKMMEAFSPALNTDKIKTPLFVIQGANDPRVNIDESDQIVRSLRKRGVEVPYMVKYNEGHGFGNEENQFEAYKAMLGFLNNKLKGELKG